MEKNHTVRNDVDVKRSSSRCFRGDNLHPREKVLCTLPAISFIPPIIFEIKEDNMHSIIMQFKNVDHCAHLRENDHLFSCRA